MFASEAWSRDIMFKLYNSLGPNIEINKVNLDLVQVKNIRFQKKMSKIRIRYEKSKTGFVCFRRWLGAGLVPKFVMTPYRTQRTWCNGYVIITSKRRRFHVIMTL